jgi:hypothetical protein
MASIGTLPNRSWITYQIHHAHCDARERRFDILVNGVPRTFRDQREAAYEAARYLKIRYPKTSSKL